jgi:hypothetical protein
MIGGLFRPPFFVYARAFFTPGREAFQARKASSSVIQLVAAYRISCPKIGHPSLPHRVAETALLSFLHPNPATYRTAIAEHVF